MIQDEQEEVGSENNEKAARILELADSQDRLATPKEMRQIVKAQGANRFRSTERLYEVLPAWGHTHEQARLATVNSTLYREIPTPPPEARLMWTAATHAGFLGGNVYVPILGTGNLFGTVPHEISKAVSLSGVSRDPFDARIAGNLYPKAWIDSGTDYSATSVIHARAQVIRLHLQRLADLRHPRRRVAGIGQQRTQGVARRDQPAVQGDHASACLEGSAQVVVLLQGEAEPVMGAGGFRIDRDGLREGFHGRFPQPLPEEPLPAAQVIRRRSLLGEPGAATPQYQPSEC